MWRTLWLVVGLVACGGDATPPAASESPPVRSVKAKAPPRAPAEAPAAAKPAPAEPTAAVDAWIPEKARSWKKEATVQHDLDGDGNIDTAYVLTGPAASDMGEDRLVVVGLNDGTTTRLVLSSPCLAMCTGCGGVFGDPFAGMEQIGERSLKVANYGGSNHRWAVEYTLAWRNEKVMVVGYDRSSFHTSDPDNESTVSINLLSGKASVDGGPLKRHSVSAMAGDDCPAIDKLQSAEL